MKTSISPMVRCGLLSPTRKAAIGLLFTGLASALVLAIPTSSMTLKVSYAQTGADRLGVESGPISDAENVKIKAFMERVALSYVVNTRIARFPGRDGGRRPEWPNDFDIRSLPGANAVLAETERSVILGWRTLWGRRCGQRFFPHAKIVRRWMLL